MFGRKKKEVAEVKEVGPDYSAFDEAVKSGKTDEAASIGSYLLNQNPKNVDFYKRFFDWILKMALESKDPLIKEGYYGLANDVCSSFNTAENEAFLALIWRRCARISVSERTATHK